MAKQKNFLKGVLHFLQREKHRNTTKVNKSQCRERNTSIHTLKLEMKSVMGPQFFTEVKS